MDARTAEFPQAIYKLHFDFQSRYIYGAHAVTQCDSAQGGRIGEDPSWVSGTVRRVAHNLDANSKAIHV